MNFPTFEQQYKTLQYLSRLQNHDNPIIRDKATKLLDKIEWSEGYENWLVFGGYNL